MPEYATYNSVDVIAKYEELSKRFEADSARQDDYRKQQDDYRKQQDEALAKMQKKIEAFFVEQALAKIESDTSKTQATLDIRIVSCMKKIFKSKRPVVNTSVL